MVRTVSPAAATVLAQRTSFVMVQVHASKPAGIANVTLPSARIVRPVKRIVHVKKVKNATAGFVKASVEMVLVTRLSVRHVRPALWIVPVLKGKSAPTVAVERTVGTAPVMPTKARTAPPVPAIANASPLNNV